MEDSEKNGWGSGLGRKVKKSYSPIFSSYKELLGSGREGRYMFNFINFIL